MRGAKHVCTTVQAVSNLIEAVENLEKVAMDKVISGNSWKNTCTDQS